MTGPPACPVAPYSPQPAQLCEETPKMAQNRAETAGMGIPAPPPNPRIGVDDDGTLDDFFATNVTSVHFEAIDQAAWYATIHLADGRIWQLNFGAKNDRAHGYAIQERVR